eukprot:9210969-Karenia_brevis.AAC.1
MVEPKTELSTGELASSVEEFASSKDAGSASKKEKENVNAKQETHTGSVFETSKTYEDKTRTYGADLSPEEEDDLDERETAIRHFLKASAPQITTQILGRVMRIFPREQPASASSSSAGEHPVDII